MVEQGTLSLDTDINTYLKQWTLPRNENLVPGFVTLRQLLSHTAGTTVHGFQGYAQGGALPTTTQILDGAPPANSTAIRMELPPGTQFRYSGGGYTIAQLAMADATKESYEALVQREVFAPLAMHHSSVALAPSDNTLRNAANAHSGGRVIPGGFHRYPELAAAAVWTTPSDLARLLIAVQHAAMGDTSTPIKPETAQLMLAQQTDGGGIAAGWGLGFALSGTGSDRRFGHDGRNEGFEATMTAYVDKGEGVVVLTNADRGKQLADEVVRAIANDYGWAGLESREVIEVDVPADALARYAGYYAYGPVQVWIDHRGKQLHARVGGATSEPLLALSPSRFIATSSGAVAEFESAGGVTGLRIVEGGPAVTLARSAPPASSLGTTPLFLRGSMNDWSTASPLPAAAAGGFAADVSLARGEYEFKLASEDWAAVDLGVAGGTDILDQVARALPLVSRGANIRLRVRTAGVFHFALDNPAQGDPTLSVRRISD